MKSPWEFELHPDLVNTDLEEVAAEAHQLSLDNPDPRVADLHWKLEYLRLNFDLIPK